MQQPMSNPASPRVSFAIASVSTALALTAANFLPGFADATLWLASVILVLLWAGVAYDANSACVRSMQAPPSDVETVGRLARCRPQLVLVAKRAQPRVSGHVHDLPKLQMREKAKRSHLHEAECSVRG